MNDRPWNVLLVDDNDMIRATIGSQLTLRGCKVTFATNGEEAFQSVQKEEPDVIICDVVMPKVDGLEFCRRLRTMGNRTPLLFLTSKGTTDDILKGLCIGADDYIAKPFHPKELEVRMLTVLRRAQPATTVLK